VANPLEQFEVDRIAPIAVGGVDASFTNASLFMLVALLLIWGFFLLATRRAAIVPGRAQAALEGLVGFVRNMSDEIIGPGGRPFLPLVFTLFLFILVMNVVGLVPGSFTPTSHIAVTATLAGFIFVLTIALGLARHGAHFLGLFVPPNTPWYLLILVVPIEIISFLSRPITHAVRLFANMTAGHILLKVFAGFVVSLGLAGGALSVLFPVPLLMTVAFYALELLVAVVQAYVFALLTCIYLNDSINLSH